MTTSPPAQPKGAAAYMPPSLVALLAGKTKRAGKTTMLVRCFPTALFIGRRDAIETVAVTVCGFCPVVYDPGFPIDDLPKLNAVIQMLGDKGIAKQYGGIVVDDGTHMMNVSMQRWDESPDAITRSGRRDDFYKYRQLDKHLTHMATGLANLGIHAGISTHLKYPETKEGVFHPGAPDVPSRGQLEAIPAWASFVGRADQNLAYPDPWWPGVLNCDNTDPTWVTGERIGAPRGEMPGNLREVLRASRLAYDIPRWPGLEWLDDYADHVAKRLDEGEKVLAVAADVWAQFVGRGAQIGSPTELHVRWAIQDGIARHVLRKKQAAGLFGDLGKRPAAAGGAPPPPPKEPV